MATFSMLFMEHYNLSRTWNAKGALGKSWRHLTSKGGDDEQSQVFAIFCVHVYTRTRMIT